jgi:hypothetical protein
MFQFDVISACAAAALSEKLEIMSGKLEVSASKCLIWASNK